MANGRKNWTSKFTRSHEKRTSSFTSTFKWTGVPRRLLISFSRETALGKVALLIIYAYVWGRGSVRGGLSRDHIYDERPNHNRVTSTSNIFGASSLIRRAAIPA